MKFSPKNTPKVAYTKSRLIVGQRLKVDQLISPNHKMLTIDLENR